MNCSMSLSMGIKFHMPDIKKSYHNIRLLMSRWYPFEYDLNFQSGFLNPDDHYLVPQRLRHEGRLSKMPSASMDYSVAVYNTPKLGNKNDIYMYINAYNAILNRSNAPLPNR